MMYLSASLYNRLSKKLICPLIISKPAIVPRRLINKDPMRQRNIGYPWLGVISSSKGDAHFSGIPDHYFDRSGKITIANIFKMFICGGIRVLRAKDFDVFKVIEGNPIYLISSRAKIDKEQHRSINIDGNDALTYSTEIVKSAETFITISSILINHTTGKVLCRMQNKFIAYNKSIGKPLQLPKWFNEKYGREVTYIDEGFAYGHVELPKIPENTFKTNLKVRPSDLDYKRHTEATKYIDFCMDCGTVASREGYYNGFRGDIVYDPITNVLVLNIGGSNADDNLVTHTWQDRKTNSILHFIICKDIKPICYISATFDVNE